MQIIKVGDYKEISSLIGERIISLINEKPNAVLGLATGSSPIGVYQYLVEAYKQKRVSFIGVRTYNLDEYFGINRLHPESYYSFMCKNLFNHVDILKTKINIPFANKETEKFDCLAYANALKRVEIDLQILGIGTNGHIGFNEPGTPFEQETFIVDLAEKTREDNKRFFSSIDEVPKKAITMGIAEIMRAKEINLIASGYQKAEAIYKLVNGDISVDFPASVLKNHPNVKIYIDQEAGSLLEVKNE